MSNRKILITGGCGFVGRHFVKRFLDAGDSVYVVDSVVAHTGGINPRLSEPSREGWPLFDPRDYGNFRFLHQDCREFFRACSDTDFDYVFHLAAIVGGRLMISHNPIAVAEDLAIDSAYWQWAVRTKPAKTICFSSSAAYPIHLQKPDDYVLLQEFMINLTSQYVGMPDTSYGWAKLTHEFLANLAYQTHGLKSAVYRPFSGYGEDQDDTYPFPSICKRALHNSDKSTLQVWGSGQQMRDFVHIEDCVDGVLQTMDSIGDAGALNLSTGIYTSMADFARLAAATCGYGPAIISTPEKPMGSFARAGDTTKQQAYGFRYKVPFIEGVTKALKYYEGAKQ